MTWLAVLAAGMVGFSGIAADKVLAEGVNKFNCWGPKQMEFEKSFANGVYKIKMIKNGAVKRSPYNLQCFFNYNQKLEKGKNYQVSVTLKSNKNLTVPVVISLGKAPWKGFAGKDAKLEANKPQTMVIPLTMKEDNGGPFRTPVLALGLAENGAEIDITSVSFSEVTK